MKIKKLPLCKMRVATELINSLVVNVSLVDY